MYNIRYVSFAALPRRRINMPIYDYRCSECGHRFELLQSISRRGEAVCPKCGGKVTQVYEGKWSVGCKNAGGSGCSGNCQGCHGCGG